MKSRVKPFTLFLCIIIVAFLLTGPLVFKAVTRDREPLEPLIPDKPDWTGMITLWDTQYIENGTGSRGRWLNRRIKEFERENPGVFIDVRRMTPQRVQMYFAASADRIILPDIISMDLYNNVIPRSMYQDISGFFDEKEIKQLHILGQKRVLKEGKMLGVPWMMGGYALIFNSNLLVERQIPLPGRTLDYDTLGDIVLKSTFKEKEGRREIQYYGFCSYTGTYSKPLLCMIYADSGKIQGDIGYKSLMDWQRQKKASPENLWEMSKNEARKMFLEEQRVGVFLGNTRMIFTARDKQSTGKGFNIHVANVPMDGKKGLFMDQVDAYGLLNNENPDKTLLCVSFLKSLLSREAQMELKDLGMFPVITGLEDIYMDDPEMYVIEKNLKNFCYGPEEDFWIKNGEAVYQSIKMEWTQVSRKGE